MPSVSRAELRARFRSQRAVAGASMPTPPGSSRLSNTAFTVQGTAAGGGWLAAVCRALRQQSAAGQLCLPFSRTSMPMSRRSRARGSSIATVSRTCAPPSTLGSHSRLPALPCARGGPSSAQLRQPRPLPAAFQCRRELLARRLRRLCQLEAQPPTTYQPPPYHPEPTHPPTSFSPMSRFSLSRRSTRTISRQYCLAVCRGARGGQLALAGAASTRGQRRAGTSFLAQLLRALQLAEYVL